jgi:hypothetical protein
MRPVSWGEDAKCRQSCEWVGSAETIVMRPVTSKGRQSNRDHQVGVHLTEGEANKLLAPLKRNRRGTPGLDRPAYLSARSLGIRGVRSPLGRYRPREAHHRRPPAEGRHPTAATISSATSIRPRATCGGPEPPKASTPGMCSSTTTAVLSAAWASAACSSGLGRRRSFPSLSTCCTTLPATPWRPAAWITGASAISRPCQHHQHGALHGYHP